MQKRYVHERQIRRRSYSDDDPEQLLHNPIIQKDLGVDPTAFTPIGLMAMDTFLLWVHTDRKDITDIKSYVSTVKSAGKNWKVGGTGSGQEDSVLTAMMEAEFGYKVTYIPFPGGGTVAKNLVGKQIDSTVNNPSEQMAFYKAGNSKPLIQFTGERMAAFPDVPTAKELGINIEYYMQRSVNGPPGMSDGAVSFTQTCSRSCLTQKNGKTSALVMDSLVTK